MFSVHRGRANASKVAATSSESGGKGVAVPQGFELCYNGAEHILCPPPPPHIVCKELKKLCAFE